MIETLYEKKDTGKEKVVDCILQQIEQYSERRFLPQLPTQRTIEHIEEDGDENDTEGEVGMTGENNKDAQKREDKCNQGTKEWQIPYIHICRYAVFIQRG